MKFIHTADWQIGKPFAGINDIQKRSLVQQMRIDVINKTGLIANESNAEFVLVAGDLFDSTHTDKATVSAACSAIGQIGLPVIVIPGNHDHAGPGCLWEQDFYQREQKALAPNMRVLLGTDPIELESAIILPCPLNRRAVASDPTEWLRNAEVYKNLPTNKPRIVLAHGSTQSFSGEEGGSISNLIDLAQLPDSEIDYIALGDWHGTKQVNSKAWFSGTPELDRFTKGDDHNPGHILRVEVERNGSPKVEIVKTAELNWSELTFDFADDTALNEFENQLQILLGQRANKDLLRLTLTGSIGIEASNHLEQILETLNARLLRLKLINQTFIAPTESEIEALTQRSADPLISNVAKQLVVQSQGNDEDAQIARLALRELHATCSQEVAS